MMNLRMLTLLALLAIIPLNGSADECPPPDPLLDCGLFIECRLNGDIVPGDPDEIEGTHSGDDIDCRCSLRSRSIYGSGGNDTIYGSPCDDFIAGGGGTDTIYGGEGDDDIDGGANDDLIYGEGGNDVIFGGVGSSSASGVDCDLVAGTGSSYLTKGGSGDDIIFGGAGNDCINAGSGEDIVHGGVGDDTIEGGNHSDILHGGSGFDTIRGAWHTDYCIDIGDIDHIDGAEFVSCELFDYFDAYCGDGICNIDIDSCFCVEDCGLVLACVDDNGNGSCSVVGSECIDNGDCCSNKCKGKEGSKTCK